MNSLSLSSCVLRDIPNEKIKAAVVGSWDNHVYVYSVECGRMQQQLVAHDEQVHIGPDLERRRLFARVVVVPDVVPRRFSPRQELHVPHFTRDVTDRHVQQRPLEACACSHNASTCAQLSLGRHTSTETQALVMAHLEPPRQRARSVGWS